MILAEVVQRPGPELVEIRVNYRPVRVPEEVTGARIKEVAHLSADFELYGIRGDEETFIANDQVVHVHPGQEFVATPGLEPA